MVPKMEIQINCIDTTVWEKFAFEQSLTTKDVIHKNEKHNLILKCLYINVRIFLCTYISGF